MTKSQKKFMDLECSISDLKDENFLKTLVHESNNFLSPISGFTEILLMEESLDVKHRSYLEEVTTAVQRHAEFNQQLLMLSGKLTPKKEEIRSDELLQLLTKKSFDVISLIEQVVTFNSNRSWLVKVFEGISTFAESLQQNKTPISLSADDNYFQLSCGFSTKPNSVNKERFFQPFYTSRKLASEKGLGLCWLPAFMKNTGGEIQLEINQLGSIELILFFEIMQ